jgi:hypothetical protein
MEFLMKTVLFLVSMIVLSGCSSLAVIEDRMADGIDAYCQKTETERESIRAVVNEKLAPHKVRVTCFGDDIRT